MRPELIYTVGGLKINQSGLELDVIARYYAFIQLLDPEQPSLREEPDGEEPTPCVISGMLDAGGSGAAPRALTEVPSLIEVPCRSQMSSEEDIREGQAGDEQGARQSAQKTQLHTKRRE